MGDGSMPPAYYAICGEMAAWMKHRAVSIHDVEAGPYPDCVDTPVTVKGDTWFLQFLTANQRSATIKSAAEPKSVTMLRTGRAVPWTKEVNGVVLIPARSDFTSLDDVVVVKW